MPPKPPLRIIMALLPILIGYGSLFPFDYVPHAPGWSDVAHLLTEWPVRLSASDVLGNVLLFVPLGLLIPALVRGTTARIGWVMAAVAYAWALQYLQFWYPSRDPTGSDAVFNTVGVLLGLLLAHSAQVALQAASGHLERSDPWWPAASAWLLLWVAYRWFPLVPTLDFDNLKAALKPLLLHPQWDPVRVLHDSAAWLLWFWLARRGAVRLLANPFVASVAAVAVLGADPLFVGGSISLSNVLGLAAALLLQWWVLAQAANGQRTASGNDWVLLGVLLAAIAASELAPFVFDASNPFLLLPFAGMLSGSMVLNTASLIEKCYLYGGALLLLVRLGFGWQAGAWLLAALLGLLEWLQIMVPGRTPELTDALLVLLLGVALKALIGLASPRAGKLGRQTFPTASLSANEQLLMRRRSQLRR